MKITCKLCDTTKTDNELILHYDIILLEDGYVTSSAKVVFDRSYRREDGHHHEWDTPQITLGCFDLERGMLTNAKRMMIFGALLEQIDIDVAPLID